MWLGAAEGSEGQNWKGGEKKPRDYLRTQKAPLLKIVTNRNGQFQKDSEEDKKQVRGKAKLRKKMNFRSKEISFASQVDLPCMCYQKHIRRQQSWEIALWSYFEF